MLFVTISSCLMLLFQGPGGLLWISSDGDDWIGAKKQNTENSVDQNFTPKQSHAEFPGHKNFQKALNDFLAQKIETLVLNTPKNPYLIKLPPKKLAKIVLPEKIQKIKNFKPKKILRLFLSLEIRSIPHPPAGFWGHFACWKGFACWNFTPC